MTLFSIYCLLLFSYATYSVATCVPGVAVPLSTCRTEYEETRDMLQGERGGLQLDLHRVVRRRTRKRDEQGEAGTAAIGLGDALDITYNVLVQVGPISTPLVLDTGSADLWVLSNAFPTNSELSYPLYPTENFNPVAEARLLYGDSRTGTHALGLIGADQVGIAGLVLEKQFFASINDTDTSVVDTGSAGIFGLGFPVNSLLWTELYTLAASGVPLSRSRRRNLPRIDLYSRPRFIPPVPLLGFAKNLAVGDNMTGDDQKSSHLEILSSFHAYGPLVSRLALKSDSLNNDDSLIPALASPQFSVALQRTTPSISGNIGTLSLGTLPSGVDNSSFTWSPVRRYTQQQNGVVVPQASDEIYPYAWEIPLDAIYFDGVRLEPSSLGDVTMDGVGHSALVDTGNSLIRGPADVVIPILSMLIQSTSQPSPFAAPAPLDTSLYTEEDYVSFTAGYEAIAYAYPCEEAHSLVFEFAGRQFQIDPRDFGRPVGDSDAQFCIPNLAPTDPPKVGGYLYSWSIGEPFLRSVLSTFYYGNLTHPSADPPRIGFLSTVPDDAAPRLSAAVQSAKSADGYPETTISAPTGTHTDIAVTTDSNGVLQVSELPVASDISSSATPSQRRLGSNASCILYFTLGADFGWRDATLTVILSIIVMTGVIV